ncbi:MAG: tRNA (adenosine(37)-N6)-threonylcarbamoyltransferase complex ATPase subunit type 1 TsaE [Oscillospiraceae bacterium]|nr:tRNA (adenosine(37)-N6)-threonylcarbamoyltransferase complex ATPase subunit type 1 TsaE [Oscillospiraceae bacterium]
MVIETRSEKETEQLGERLGKKLPPGTVVALYGELGVGKTAFVRGLARGAGYYGRVQSPTYTIVNEYLGETPVFHFDMYRLCSSDELYGIGWEDYLARDGICVTEWSERIEDALDGECIRVKIERTGETSRLISFDGGKDVIL